ncbi:DNA-processing protein DprA [Microlunatus capsulatus]|uniref:DNA processing protein n=1 Tax=Microlunatus capsulatus TaxID=99117 RepID=A0ABS4ZD47_9ACTN|nr:DNA-processing protein DprA [Microlunatus capsulatus]MBP2418655.1 DNA processing protein [Microlunatus capsulatus]
MWSEKRARTALSCAVDGGEPEAARLVARVGAQGAWAKIAEGALGEPLARRAAATDVEVVERLAARVGARFVVPGEDEWVAGLDDLAHVEPIQRRGGLPFGLWLRGPGHLGALTQRAVAVVGSRAATAYGAGVATDLGAELAEHGVTVVSGLAFGIDAAAHRGALAAGGPTVAVLANGVDVAYPPGNTPLFEAVARDHLVVSELPPGAHPTRVRFLARNRLIAALAQGTVVVEAALRSGARNTAGWALECGRPLMAVPGPVHSRASTAPHLMIRNGQATLVTCAAEVVELVGGLGQHPVAAGVTPQRATDALTEQQLAVFEATPARSRVSSGEIALAAGVPVPSCLAALHALEDRGLVEGSERGWRAVPHRAMLPAPA